MRRLNVVVGGIGMLGWVGGACATPMVSFQFTELSTNYSAQTQTLNIQAVNADPLHSTGTITRHISPEGIARFFPPGTVMNDAWNLQLITSVVTADESTANGGGLFILTDADGDGFSANVLSTFRFIRPGEIALACVMRNFEFLRGGNGRIEGSDGTGWGNEFGEVMVTEGAFEASIFGGTTFFSATFVGRDTLLEGEIVPTPATFLPLAAALAIAARRRRA